MDLRAEFERRAQAAEHESSRVSDDEGDKAMGAIDAVVGRDFRDVDDEVPLAESAGSSDVGRGDLDSDVGIANAEDLETDRLRQALRDVVAVVPEPPTGDDSVDQAVRRLNELPDLNVPEHVGVFEAIHAALQDRLADAEE